MLVNTQAAAEWACATGRSMMKSVMEVVPQPLRAGREHSYSPGFGLEVGA
jgi:hypothetical protein